MGFRVPRLGFRGWGFFGATMGGAGWLGGWGFGFFGATMGCRLFTRLGLLWAVDGAQVGYASFSGMQP